MRGLFRWVFAVLCGAMAWSLWSADGFFDGRQPVGFYPGSEFPGARGAVTATNGEARLDYDFSRGGAYVAASLNLSPRRPAKQISFDVFHDAPCVVSVRFWDATGQVFQHVFAGAAATGRWVRVECACLKDRTSAYWEGACDGIVHLPLGMIQVMAGNPQDCKRPGGPCGTLRIRSFALADQTPDERAAAAAALARPDTVETLVSDFDRGDAHLLDGLPFTSSSGTFSSGAWSFSLLPRVPVTLKRSIPIYGSPVSYALELETSATLAGADVQVELQSNWLHFTNTVGRLVRPPDGAKSVRQVISFPAPPGNGWVGFGTPKDGKPEPPFCFTRLSVASAGEKRIYGTVRLVSLKAYVPAGEPVLRAAPPSEGPAPAQVLVELHNLGRGCAEGSFEATLTDWDGRERGRAVTPAASVPEGACGRTQVNVPRVSEDMNAAFYTVRFRGRDGKSCGKAVTTTWTRPLASGVAPALRPDLPWGMGVYLGRHILPGYDFTRLERVAALARDAGVKWIREGLGGWRRPDGTFDFKTQDDMLAVARRHGLSVYGLVAGDTRSTFICTPEGRAAYASNIVACVRHYGPLGVKDWEIWNEPNHPGFWKGPHEDYVTLLKTAYEAVKRTDPAAQVLGCSTAGLDWKFIGLCVSNQAPFDAVTTHPYRGTADETSFRKDLDRVTEMVGGRKNWLTELGWSTWKKGCDEHEQASNLARVYFMSAATPGVKNICWYDFVNDGFNPHYCEENFGILRRDLAPKPAYRALAKVCRTFTEGQPELTGVPLPGGRGKAWLFRMGGQAAVWTDAAQPTEVVLPVRRDARITNLMDEPFSGRPVAEGVLVTVDCAHPLFVAAYLPHVEGSACRQPR